MVPKSKTKTTKTTASKAKTATAAIDLGATDLRQSHPAEWKMASAIRALSMDAVEAARSGHPGLPMGMADVAAVLFGKHLIYDPAAPRWPDRDRFVLSAGHGSMLLYSLLHLAGYDDMPSSKLKLFRQLESGTAGHPEFGEALGVETTTGPLGQGLANAVGMALGERMLAARYGDRIVNHRTYALVGDGCLMEGVSQEAITFAGRHNLSKLIVLWDDNSITIDGSIALADATDQRQRFESAGWNTLAVDGHHYDEIDAALSEAKKSDKPVMIACKTLIGYGAPNKAGGAGIHGAPLGAEEVAAARAAIGWTAKPFNVPKEVQKLWAAASERGVEARKMWLARYARLSAKRKAAFTEDPRDVPAPKELSAAVKNAKQEWSAAAPAMATRKASQLALEKVLPLTPQMVGGSADLTGSNNTKVAGFEPIAPGDFSGRYIHYGVREHGMAAIMNGLALHGGFIPYGGTFLVFSDYMRPAMRLSALMGLGVIYVLTHDSIGLGEDGPTHQPVEHLAALRAIPNLAVYRPADVIEAIEAWELAVEDRKRPSVIALSRQNLPLLRTAHTIRNETRRGAYVLKEAETEGSARPKAILMASGSEASIALEARDLLQKDGVPTRVVSTPCLDRFAEEDDRYRARILPRGPVRVAIEAGVRDGWDRWLCGERGDFRKADFVGMQSFGASGPAAALYEHFGITPKVVAERTKALLPR